ncbi:MAG: signal peptide peptidase SppA [Kiritimatiellia bacterium]|jgi:protease-4
MSEPTEKRRRPSALYWIFTIGVVLALGVSIFMNVGLGLALSLTSSGHTSEPDLPVDQYPEFDEEWSYGTGTVKVARMELTGFIIRESDGGWLEPEMDHISRLQLAIRAATRDPEIKAIILEVDSPGGSVTASDELYHELMLFRAADEDRKVVVFLRDTAASGAYYVAMAGHWLIAQPTSIIGSIGVIMQTLNWSQLSDRMGVTDTTIKSGDNKDLLNPFRATDTNQVVLLQEVVDQLYDRFRGIVATSRNVEDRQLDVLADGRIFSAEKALEENLIDEIGYWDQAVNKTAELLGVDDIKVVRYYQPYGLFDFVFGSANLKRLLPDALANRAPRLEYRWQP